MMENARNSNYRDITLEEAEQGVWATLLYNLSGEGCEWERNGFTIGDTVWVESMGGEFGSSICNISLKGDGNGTLGSYLEVGLKKEEDWINI